jgi:hypothetical protein
VSACPGCDALQVMMLAAFDQRDTALAKVAALEAELVRLGKVLVLAERAPLPPEILADTLQDRVHVDGGKLIKAKRMLALMDQIEVDTAARLKNAGIALGPGQACAECGSEEPCYSDCSKWPGQGGKEQGE